MFRGFNMFTSAPLLWGLLIFPSKTTSTFKKIAITWARRMGFVTGNYGAKFQQRINPEEKARSAREEEKCAQKLI